MTLEQKLKKYSERKAEEHADKFAKPIDGYPKSDFQAGFSAAVELLGGAVDCSMELADLVEAAHEGEYQIDYFTSQPIRRALAEIERKLEEK
jgi:hypothetical protein